MTATSLCEIRPLREEFLDDVIRIHQAGLGYSLNSRLGNGHLRLLYRILAQDPGSYVGIAMLHGRPVGVVSGTVDARAMSTRMLGRLPRRHVLGIVLKVLTQPWLVFWWWQSTVISAPIRHQSEEVIAVLTAIAVDPDFRGQGIGRKLVEAFEGFMKGAQVRSYRLDTRIQNAAASALYLGLGFHEAARRAGSLVLVKTLG